ncbi:[protein-PII] uridylyltransferase [Anaeromyxobacter diazotrophicus]|uniref:Bifunctional uridylyltransferase/uridylyl-removing enzyme n=1 Tax=Anaeromyxobacter diazotrophicus TaxID=2590199 RepID=A0A7I9VM14_9BACT|nr:[protein-PII] uridylyltransferase [Anaeromyxobacter diazotrophicus]GEJ57452.1 bifunctional uridylyltransferase/uridylyl-removing enzyme [Anaeromyxobacter diazotrophicus]
MRLPDAPMVRLPQPAPYEYDSRLPDLPPLGGDARADLAAARRFLEDLHRGGASGHTVVRLQSAALDRIVGALWARACAEAAERHPEAPLALVAIGGYGRRELAPFSDLDLLFLHAAGEPAPFVKLASERLVYALWDLRLEVGYSVRDLAACEATAAEDHTARTALLDLRQLAGDRLLYRALEREQLHGPTQARLDEFITDKIAEVRSRREKFGDSLYLLEPNVKESQGGLRDLQSALWIARARWKVAGVTELLARAILPESEIGELRRARDFLWRVRNEMHYLAGRKWDQLTFDVQPQVAEFMGYRDGEEGSAVEQFMRHYYLAARTVLNACDAIVDRALEPQNATGWRQVPPPAAMTGAERNGGPRRSEWALPGGELKVFRGRLTIADKDVLRRSPAALVRLFAAADRENLDLYPYARDQASAAAAELPPGAADQPEVSQELLACFLRPGTRGRFLDLMHQLGVLPRLIPEFARVAARRQIDVYHVYTVDVHSLFAVRRLFALRNGDVQEEVLGPLMQRLQRPLGLYLGTLFHDIGKGLGGDHSAKGAEIAAQACVRLGIDPADAADVEWLVAKHLRMSAIAQRRDLSDPHLIQAFAEECGTLDRLDELYLLTYADMATVGPRTWTDWKARLLRELYTKTRQVMEAGVGSRPEPGTAEAAARARVAAAFGARAPERPVQRFLAAMPARYFLTVEPAQAPRHLRLLRLAKSLRFASAVRHRRDLGYSELALTAPDRPGLLALLAGVLAAHRIDIQRAEVFSTPPDERTLGWLGGRALDLFQVRGPEEGALDARRWRAARRDLLRVLCGEESLDALLERRLKSGLPPKPLPGVATKVVLDNDASRDHSVIDVFTADRVGLLHTLARKAFDLGLTVDLARITTEGHRAADAFYVRTAEGARLEGERAERVLESLRAVLARPVP